MAQLIDTTGVTVFDGTIVDGTVGQETGAGAATSVPNNAQANLEWMNNPAPVGEALLDLTDPTAPTIVQGGVYTVSVSVQAVDALTVGVTLVTTLQLGPSVIMTSSVVAAEPFPIVSLSATAVLAAGDLVRLICQQDDVAARNCGIQAAAVVKSG